MIEIMTILYPGRESIRHIYDENLIFMMGEAGDGGFSEQIHTKCCLGIITYYQIGLSNKKLI